MSDIRELPDARVAAAWESLTMVVDPEIGLDIVTLGLIYEVTIEGDVVHVVHTLTTHGCPMERVITDGIREAVSHVRGVSGVETRLVWDPAWHSGMIAPEAWLSA